MQRTFIHLLTGAAACLLLLLGSFSAMAQSKGGASRTITGSVVDAQGVPVIGATILLENNQTVYALTDLDGLFTMQVPATGRLVVSSIGFVTQNVDLSASQTKYSIVLKEDAILLDDVVVVGYV